MMCHQDDPGDNLQVENGVGLTIQMSGVQTATQGFSLGEGTGWSMEGVGSSHNPQQMTQAGEDILLH
jgi:hypothetical protein